MKTKKTILITGTHHTPAIELIQILQKDKAIDWNIHYAGHQYSTETHILHTIIPKLNIPFHNIKCGKFNRKDVVKTITGFPQTISAFIKSLQLIHLLKPQIVVSFGGYVSVPVIMAAFFYKTPSITHEQTLTNSLATRINSIFVNKVALSFDNKSQINQLPLSKVVITGNLIRQQIFDTSSVFFRNLKLEIRNFPLIYITGGNQGSEFLNNLVYQLVPKLAKNFTIIHQTGKNYNTHLQTQFQKEFPNYLPFEYIEIEDIGWILNHANLIISRAGANICQEIDILNKNTILIPLPYTQQNEQLKNAHWLKMRHSQNIKVISQNHASVNKIYKTILKLQKTPTPSIKSSPQIIHPLFNLIHELV